ncbi:class I SAM-dependent methyltransferase [Plantactinospora sp. DSM 117369]
MQVQGAPHDLARPANSGFYRCSQASSLIMRVAHFPDELLSLLQLESVTVFDSTTRYGRDAIIELGCYDGRALEISRVADVGYLGIDIDATAVTRLRARISEEGLENQAKALVADALAHEQWWSAVEARRPLVHLPFNFLGICPDPGAVLRSVSKSGALLHVSVFNGREPTTRVRHRYYDACGIKALNVGPGPYGGTLFTGDDDFFSQSFSPVHLDELLATCGLNRLWRTENRVGFCVVAQSGQD